ncbi:glycosyltransferase family 1 protein [Fulvimarina endophytica]|uniref:Glycosyltransferase family 1 protein n=1 Tax=Fulvimarina endophytica TaxID=2293836 RepID=A0A371X289_9HYPH|nr:glycosyltransferase family 4 protein [Fulvimarina endophytica]RFC63345.1 glycosyltransferase family 1 protein [Fulvimarina endophytica]
MTASFVFAIPGDLETKTGGYAYDRRMIAELEGLGWSVTHLQLPASFPDPAPEDLRRAGDLFAALPDGTTVFVDGLAYGVLPELAEREASRLRLAALVHHPLHLETGIAAGRAAELRASEGRALAAAHAIVVTSAATGRDLQRGFGIEGDRITVAPPGTQKSERSSGSAGAPVILSIGSLVERKGHADLVSALATLRDRDWRCRIVGDATRDPGHARKLESLIADRDLADRIEIAGALPDLEEAYGSADIFALATRHEGYGMVFAEAMSHGLPIVGTRAGAVPDVVPPEAGILVEPGDIPALAGGLERMIDDKDRRRRFADGAYAAGSRLPTWAQSARAISQALKEIAA